jgi:hypothetical protein
MSINYSIRKWLITRVAHYQGAWLNYLANTIKYTILNLTCICKAHRFDRFDAGHLKALDSGRLMMLCLQAY